MEIVTIIVSSITVFFLIQQYRETLKQNKLDRVVRIATDFFNPLEQEFKRFDKMFYQDSIKYFYDNMLKNYTSLNIKDVFFHEENSEGECIYGSSQHGLINVTKLYYLVMPEFNLEKHVFTKENLEKEIKNLFYKMETIANLVYEFKDITFIKLKFDEVFFTPYISNMNSSIAFYIFHDKNIFEDMQNNYPKFFKIYFTNKMVQLTSNKLFTMFFTDELVSFQKNKPVFFKDTIEHVGKYNEEFKQSLVDSFSKNELFNYDTFKDAILDLKNKDIPLYDGLWLIYYSRKKVVSNNIKLIQEENYIKNTILTCMDSLSSSIDEKTIESIKIKLHNFINFLYCTSHFSNCSFHGSISKYKIFKIINETIN